MATKINPIPVLTGESAKRFNEKADQNLAVKREPRDRSQDIASLKAILRTAKI